MTAMTALLGFTAWTLAIIGIVLTWRVVEILRGRPANSWTRGAAIESPSLVKRAEHAHLNCMENLPIFAVIVLAAEFLGQGTAIASAAAWVLYARIAQSTIHLIGTAPVLVLLRAGFFAAQYALFVYLLWIIACR